MKTTTLVLILLAGPAALAAQGTTGMHAEAQANAHAKMEIPSSFSASSRTRLEATYARAQAHHVPTGAIADRVDEGTAKGASDARIVAAASKVEANEEAADRAMVKAGHQPTDNEIQAGAYAMERGVTTAQLSSLVRHAPPGRSLEVALDVITRLNEQGLPVGTALARVQSKLDAHASDAAIGSLVAKGSGVVKIGGGH